MRWLTATAALVIVCAAGPARIGAASDHFAALAVSLTGANGGQTARIDIGIDEWSTEADRDRFALVGERDGMAAVVTALQDARRIGYLRVGTQLGNEITFARETPEPDGGRHILIVLARMLGAAELRWGSLTDDYPFTVVDVHLRGGSGAGRITVGAKVTFRRGEDGIHVDPFSAAYIALRDLRATP